MLVPDFWLIQRREIITPVLVSLHWLPVEFWIGFKVLLMVFKALHGIFPKYIADLLIPYKNTRISRSSNQMILHVPKTRLKSKGDRAFSVAAPSLWNPLPMHIKSSPSVDAFKSRLKSYLFSRAFRVDQRDQVLNCNVEFCWVVVEFCLCDCM